MKPIDQLTEEELRVECAEAQGAKWYTFASGQHWLSFKPLADHFALSTCPKDFETTTIHEGVPNYPTDANAALALAAALAEKGLPVVITHNKSWVCVVYSSYEIDCDELANASAPTFPLALCRAYLAVIRSESNS